MEMVGCGAVTSKDSFLWGAGGVNPLLAPHQEGFEVLRPYFS